MSSLRTATRITPAHHNYTKARTSAKTQHSHR